MKFTEFLWNEKHFNSKIITKLKLIGNYMLSASCQNQSVEFIYEMPFVWTEEDKQVGNQLNKIPKELVLICLHNLDLKSFVSFAQVCKECYIITSHPVICKLVMEKMSIIVNSQVTKSDCHKGFAEKKKCDFLIYDRLQLRCIRQHHDYAKR